MTRKFPTALLRPLAQQAFIGLLDTTPLAEGIPDYPPAHFRDWSRSDRNDVLSDRSRRAVAISPTAYC